MKDFSLLYGPARTWAVIVATALVAVAIAFFAQGSDGAGQEVQTEDSIRRSSSQSESTPEPEIADEAEDEIVSNSAEAWARSPQSASDIPFVSLQPSPEAITDAGKDLISANTSTSGGAVGDAPAPRATQPDPPTVPGPEPEQPRTTTPPPEPVANTSNPTPEQDRSDEEADTADGDEGDGGGQEDPESSQPESTQPQPETTQPESPQTTPPTEAPSTSCQAQGASRLAAVINYRLSCSLPLRDCDPLADGGWICSSERI